MRPPKKRALTILLIKAGITVDEAIDPLKVSGDVGVPLGSSVIGRLFTRPSIPKPPRWMDFFEGAVDLTSLHLVNSSTAAVLMVPVEGRLFAVTFGYGRHLLRPSAIEENFGLHVTLNAVSPEKIRSIDKETFDAIARHTREQASNDAPLLEFGVDVEQDLLRAVVGTPDDPADGERLTGRDALVFQGRLTLAGLPAQLERCLRRSRDVGYRKAFPWVDRLNEIRDVAQRSLLDQRLLEHLRQGDLDRCWLAVPEIIDWADAAGFVYGPTSDLSEVDFDLYLPRFLDRMDDKGQLSVDLLKHRKVLCVNASQDAVLYEWPIYRCLHAEIEEGTQTNLLSGGKWYRVETEFVKVVNQHFAQVKEADTQLPSYREDDKGERGYNERAAAGNPSLVLVDRKTIPFGGGSSQIEFCDLYSGSKQLIHVKRYGGSSVLSHLFAQGVVAARLLHDPLFRVAVNKKLPDSHRLNESNARPIPSEFEVVYAIVSQSKKKLWIPFFSRVNLRQATKELERLGFRVALAKVAVQAGQENAREG